MKNINNFFWWCSGVNNQILNHQICKIDHSKYFGIGCAVFITGIFASIASCFALKFIFESNSFGSNIVITFISLLWGFTIFMFDRLIVATFDKMQTPLHQFLNALPRLILAILIGIIISTPLELTIFEKEINNLLVIEKESFKIDREQKNNARINIFRLERDKYKNEILNKENRKIATENEMKCECNGTCGTAKAGTGPECRRLTMLYESANMELRTSMQDFLPKIDSLEKTINKILNEGVVIGNESYKNYKVGIEARIRALHSLPTATPLIIALLFIFIETMPVFLKLIISAGPYDRLVEAEKIQAHSIAKEIISTKNKEINIKLKDMYASIKLHSDTKDAVNERELEDKKEMMRIVSEEQIKFVKKIVQKWGESKNQDFEDNPTKYFKEKI